MFRDGTPPFNFKAVPQQAYAVFGKSRHRSSGIVRSHASLGNLSSNCELVIGGRTTTWNSQRFRHGRQILVVEDDPLIALDLKATLEHAGMVVKVAARLADAMLLVQKSLPDAAVLDVRLEVGTSLPLAEPARRAGCSVSFPDKRSDCHRCPTFRRSRASQAVPARRSDCSACRFAGHSSLTGLFNQQTTDPTLLYVGAEIARRSGGRRHSYGYGGRAGKGIAKRREEIADVTR